MAGFQHAIAGGQGNLIVQKFQSPNFVHGVSGWQVTILGDAEFNSIVLRGSFNGTDFVINSSGAFFYSGTPAAGNLVASVTNAAGADSFGNNYVTGHASYGAGFATSLNAGFVQFYTGSLAGGWTPGATVQTDAFGDLILTAARSVLTGNNTLDDGAGNAAIAGGLTVGGSNQTSTATGNPATSGPNGGVFAGHTHFFAGHTHTL